jgi:hypothetical protein
MTIPVLLPASEVGVSEEKEVRTMNENKKNRKHRIIFRVNDEELRIIEALYKSTTYKYFAGYARSILLKKPVTVKYRNQSADEILSSLILLKKEINHIGNNINQAVKKLHMLDENEKIRSWISIHESFADELNKKINELDQLTLQLNRKW